LSRPTPVIQLTRGTPAINLPVAPGMCEPLDLTTMLQAVRNGDMRAADELFRRVYGELHRIASGQRRRWGGNDTLNTTALVHEAYLKLVNQDVAAWNDRAHFFAVAAKAMRHILINYAEMQVAAKRGGGAVHVPLGDADLVAPEAAEDLLALDEALTALAAVHERSSRVVECRFFGGFDIQETANTLAVSPATVQRDWAFASAWLRRKIGGPLPRE
jgi:RNA polymerase sigma factor (TIGR02999 family)